MALRLTARVLLVPAPTRSGRRARVSVTIRLSLATARRTMSDVVMLRPMTLSDPAVCVEIVDQAFTEMRTRFSLPMANWTGQDARHQEQRFAGFLNTDPAGSWVAVDSHEILGFAQAIIRDNSLWMLS